MHTTNILHRFNCGDRAIFCLAGEVCFSSCDKPNDAVLEREERVIFADADAFAGKDAQPPLANQHFTDAHLLTVTPLDAEKLRF